MGERLPDGRVVTGGPTDVKGKVTLTANEKKELKQQMYQDFLSAKQTGKINLEYTFDSWIRDSMEMLKGARKAEIETQRRVGTLSEAEYKALNEVRENMISAIIQMDFSEFDKYGIQFIDPSSATVRTGDGLLLPSHRKDVVKFKKEILH
jgi:hypothetical protein